MGSSHEVARWWQPAASLGGLSGTWAAGGLSEVGHSQWGEVGGTQERIRGEAEEDPLGDS